ncbi:PAS domain S-box protein [Chloroflexota bacterium]
MSEGMIPENRLIHLNQVLRAIRNVNQIILQEKNRDRLVENICRALIETRGYYNAWIVLFDESGKFIMATEAGLGKSFSPMIAQFKRGELTSCGHQALTQSGIVVVNDPIINCADCPLAKSYSYRGGLSIRLEYGDRVYGLMSASIPAQLTADVEECSLFEGVAQDIAFALYNIQLAEDQRQAEQALRESEGRYRILFKNAGEAILLCSPSGRIVSANKACETLTGYSYDELESMNLREFFSCEDWRIIDRLLLSATSEQTLDDIEELSLIRKDQSEAFARLRINSVLSGEHEFGLQVMALDVTEEIRLRHNMQYYITQITRAQEDERLRISRELHDETAQSLAGLSRDLGSLISGESRLSSTTSEHLKKLRGMADSALEEVRRFSQDLRPSILDDLGLLPAVEWLTANLNKEAGIATKVNNIGTQYRLSPSNELTIFRIVQEILNNVRRHSKAAFIETTIDFGDDALTIITSDNGQGFHMPQRASDLLSSGKLGIVGMRERARLIGSTLIIQSEVGKGTTATLRVPR